MVGPESLTKDAFFNGLTERLAIKFHGSFRELWLTDFKQLVVNAS